MRETQRHRNAFYTYYEMGEDRTLASLSDHLKITERTAKQWSREFHWQERIKRRDMENISQGDSQSIDELQRQIVALRDRLDAIEQDFKAHRSWSGHRRF